MSIDNPKDSLRLRAHIANANLTPLNTLIFNLYVLYDINLCLSLTFDSFIAIDVVKKVALKKMKEQEIAE